MTVVNTENISSESDNVVCVFVSYFVLGVTALTAAGEVVLVLQLLLSIFSQ